MSKNTVSVFGALISEITWWSLWLTWYRAYYIPRQVLAAVAWVWLRPELFAACHPPPLSLSCHSLCCDYLILKKQTCPRKSKKRKEKKKYLVGRKACIHSRAPVRLTLTWLGTINRTVWFLVLCDISTAMFSNRGCLHHMVPKSTWLNWWFLTFLLAEFNNEGRTHSRKWPLLEKCHNNPHMHGFTVQHGPGGNICQRSQNWNNNSYRKGCHCPLKSNHRQHWGMTQPMKYYLRN